MAEDEVLSRVFVNLWSTLCRGYGEEGARRGLGQGPWAEISENKVSNLHLEA